jgi:nucleoside-diphosphate-sugar epimerase
VGAALGRLAGDDPRGGLVLHLAGKNSAPQSLVEPYETFDLNVGGTAALLEACRIHPAPVTVAVMSTAAVCEAPTGSGAISESAPLGPASPYAASKACAETLVFSYHRSLGVPGIVARLFNVYGPGQLSDAVIPSIIRQMLDGGDLRLGNTAAVRDFIFVDDAVDAFLSLGAAKASAGKAVNIGTGRGASIAEVVEILRRITGFAGKVIVDQARLRPRDADAIVADTSRLRELTGWAPATDLERGLAAAVAAAGDERAS